MGRYNGYAWGAVTAYMFLFSSGNNSSSAFSAATSGSSYTLYSPSGTSFTQSTLVTLDKPVTGTRFRFVVVEYTHWPSMAFELYTTTCLSPPSPPLPRLPPPSPPRPPSISYDVSKMVRLDLCSKFNGGAPKAGLFCVDLVGSAVSAAGVVVFADTGSWDLSIPLSCVNMSKVTILQANTLTPGFAVPAHYVSGQVGLRSADGKTKYLAEVR